MAVHRKHAARTDRGRSFGATDVVAERGEEGATRIRELTGGHDTDVVLECVGGSDTLQMSFDVVQDGGTISRVGLPRYTEGPIGPSMLMRNITLTGGASPARAYIDELLPDVLNGVIEPGQVFDRTVGLEEIAVGYREMADRQALKVLVRP
jgi:threonine dehydrogenase-like Zn-dependent dehydrogenase